MHPLLSRKVLAADDDGLALWNPTAPELSATEVRLLRGVALDHPDYLGGVTRGKTATVDRVRLGPDGIFIDGKRIGDFNRVFEYVARVDIVEIRGLVSHGHRGLWTVVGVVGGFYVGTVGACALMRCADSDAPAVGAIAVLVGIGSGVTAGIIGHRVGGRTEEGVIYRR